MKKILYLLPFLILSFTAFAQEPLVLQPVPRDTIKEPKDTSWKINGFFGLNFSQTALSNWQGGGAANVAGNAIFNLQADYHKGNHEWINKVDAQFGVIRPGDDKLFRKNIDQLFALSKYDVKAFKFRKDWFYAVQADYRTQFAPGYIYSGDSVKGKATSGMNSPGYIQLAIGLDFKPAEYFSATIAPVSGKITIVNRQYLADEGAYGVTPAVMDANGNIIKHGKKVRAECGGRLILKFKKDIFKNINLDSYLDLFSDYFHNPQNIDVVFNNLITFKINRYFTANIISQMIYDDDIVIKHGDINGPRLQMINTLSLGFGYKF